MPSRSKSPKRHYLKIPASIAEYYPGQRPDDAKIQVSKAALPQDPCLRWRTAIFDDTTAGGKAMVVEPLLPNAKGTIAAGPGDRFRIQIAKDDYRTDTLFVIRVENATTPRRVLRTIHASFAVWPGGSPPSLDPIASSFQDILTEPSLSHEQEDDTSVYVAPSPRVRHFFSNLPSTQRSLLRPCLAPDESLSPAQLLTPLRALWKRFRLDRFTDLTPRQHLFLTGTTTPAHLPDKERFSLFSRFGFGLMNRLVLDDHIDLVPLVQSLSQTHLPCSIRLNMWLLCLTGLDSSALRHELLEVRDWLAAAASGADPQDIEAVLVPPLRELAHNSDDSELAQLLDTSHAPGEVLARPQSMGTRASGRYVRPRGHVGTGRHFPRTRLPCYAARLSLRPHRQTVANRRLGYEVAWC